MQLRMSLADYVAKYPRRSAWKAKLEAAWLEEPKRKPSPLRYLSD